MEKIVGKVTESERDEIKALFERKNALAELAKVITSDSDLYERLITDMMQTNEKFQQWWSEMSVKYRWESEATKKWRINFDTCEIVLE